MPDPIQLPVPHPVVTVRAGSFFVVPALYSTGTTGTTHWAWGCHDCDASGNATSPEDLGCQLARHHGECTDQHGHLASGK